MHCFKGQNKVLYIWHSNYWVNLKYAYNKEEMITRHFYTKLAATKNGSQALSLAQPFQTNPILSTQGHCPFESEIWAIFANICCTDQSLNEQVAQNLKIMSLA